MSSYKKPFHQRDEEVLTADGKHFAFADSVQAAAEIVSLANTAHRAVQASDRYEERLSLIRGEPKRSPYWRPVNEQEIGLEPMRVEEDR